MSDVLFAPDLREVLDAEPELLAIADALAETQDAEDWPLPKRVTRSQPERMRGGPVPRGYLVGFLALVTVAVVASALAASGVNPLSAFGSWFSGSPGEPAPAAAEQQFVAANGRSWAFPKGTKLRVLLRATVGKQRYVLYGFRSGDSACLRLSAVSLRTSMKPACAPISALARTSAPVLVVTGHGPVVTDPARRSAQASFGIVADGITRVDVHAIDGTHRAQVGGNAYLWVEHDPNTGNRVLSLTAISRSGSRTVVPVAAPWSFSEYQSSAAAASPGGPSRVEATIEHPTIGWLDRHEPIGRSPAQVHVPAGARALVNASFTRFVKPDPLSNLIVGVSQDTLFIGNGGGGGGEFFSRGPLHAMLIGGGSGSDQFFTIAGIAADGVSKIKVFLPHNQSQVAALRDNVFAVTLPSQTAARLVAYNRKGLVVGIHEVPVIPPIRVAPPAARKPLKPVLRLTGPHGATATLSIGRTVDYVAPAPAKPARVGSGGTSRARVHCWRIAFSNGQAQSACQPVRERGMLLRVDAVHPVGRDVFIVGFTRAPIAWATLRFTNGDTVTARPVGGILIFAVPRSHLITDSQRAVVIGYRDQDHVVERIAVAFRANT